MLLEPSLSMGSIQAKGGITIRSEQNEIKTNNNSNANKST